jgi:hypothetical protein
MTAARAVCEAGRKASTKTLAELKRNGADLNAMHRGYRAMHALIQEHPHAHGGKPEPSRIACLKWMLKNGVDPELEGAWPASRAILVAAFTGIPEYVEILRAAGAKVDGFVHAALGTLKKADAEFAQAVTGAGRMTALHCCCASRMKSKRLFAIAKMLLDLGADPNALAKSWAHEVDAAYFAAGSGQIDTFELLLERGVNADAALVHAMWQNHTNMADIALRHGANVDRARDGKKPLLNQMIRWGRLKQTLWLLEHNASPNTPDERGWTAMHQAASRGNEHMLRAVLAADGDRNRKTKDGHTPLEILRISNVKAALLAAFKEHS